jgi:soluble lytic murein transglycosylase
MHCGIRLWLKKALLAATLSCSAMVDRACAQSFGSDDGLLTGTIAYSGPWKISAADRVPDLSVLKAAAEFYRRDDLPAGDVLAQQLSDPVSRVAAEWVALRSAGRSVGFDRINRFLLANPDVPMQRWLQRRAEDALIIERARPDKVLAFFQSRQPEGANGRAALAVALLSRNEEGRAERLALEAYRDKGLTRDVVTYLESAFPVLLAGPEKSMRAHRLILNNRVVEGLSIAASLGDDQLKLARALAAAQGRGTNLRPIDAVPAALRSHSSYLLARAQVLRRLNRHEEARDLLAASPRAGYLLADPDEWWTERRLLVRRLLDKGDFAGAYRIAAHHSAASLGRRAEAEFHAGWVALRYLNHPQTALMHFVESGRLAELTGAKSRAAYWQGRAIEAGAIADRTVHAAYQAAGGWPATYYGQLALERLGDAALDLPVTRASEADESLVRASPAGQLIQRLLDADLKDFAVPLAIDFARTAASASQVDAIAARFVDRDDAPTVVAIGRMATARGFALEHHAFPVFGIPSYEPLPGSQEKAIIYAIARQESAFNGKAISPANARGLMQMLPSTAARTASRFKVPFSAERLIAEPAYNAMLGAAHLGELMEETRGSLVMTFAAYNAGGHRVREWVESFGDPRKPGVDVVDWVERIPFYETRHYVQKVMENLQVYRARFGETGQALLIGQDMERGRKP